MTRFVALALLVCCRPAVLPAAGQPSFAETIGAVQARVAKIYGAGGFQGLEAYQTGLFISPQGHVLTALSYVLNTDQITVVLADGRRFPARLLGADPRLEIAIIKVDIDEVPHFNLDDADSAAIGRRVLAASNLFGIATGDEPVSVQKAVVAAVTKLEGRRGVYSTPYRGPIYVLDAVTNNPGAAGGAVVTFSGRLVGMLGKELRNERNNTWLNFAIPISEMRAAVAAILAGRPIDTANAASRPPVPVTIDALGLVLVPDVVERTPPYVDAVRPNSPAATAGIRADDLIVLVNERLVQSVAAFKAELATLDASGPLALAVLRDRQLVDIKLTLQEQTP